MRTLPNLDHYFETIIEEDLYSNKRRLQFYLKTLFEGIDFSGKKVLDIGGGSGIYSFFVAVMGAKKVVCLEPEIEGSTSGISDKFNRLRMLLDCDDNVELKSITFQSLELKSETYDIVLLHNSINHLDEPACVNLLIDSISNNIYQEIAAKIYSLSNHGARLILCDCSRYNFFQLLKIQNPFAPTIEWHKHQKPEIWANLFIEAGFIKLKIQWNSFNALGNLGRLITGNQVMAYFLRSHFCLTMIKP